MSDQNLTSANERLEELKNLVRDIKRLAATRSLSLPAAGITSAVAAAFGALALGPLFLLGTSGLGLAAVAISRQLLTNKTERAIALAKALHDEGSLSEEDFAEYMRSFREATETRPVKS